MASTGIPRPSSPPKDRRLGAYLSFKNTVLRKYGRQVEDTEMGGVGKDTAKGTFAQS
jgi:hypothetical protein